MINDLVERLRFLASGQNDPHSLAITEATNRIEELEKQLLASNKQIKELEDEIENLEYEMCELENNS